jgi:Rab5 GDP/GTP exchange factor
MDEESGQEPLSPPSPPPKPDSPNHTRDTSLQEILRQFDPLSSDRDTDEKAPVPPPKDLSPSASPSSSKPALPEKDVGEGKQRARRHSTLSVEKPPPAEPDQPFEFHRFLEQMRHKSADGVARYMKRYFSQ